MYLVPNFISETDRHTDMMMNLSFRLIEASKGYALKFIITAPRTLFFASKQTTTECAMNVNVS
jgi:hypothetical protein